MNTDMEDQILRMIEAMDNMATTEFAESPGSKAPFETSFPIEGESYDHALLVCEGLQIGLRERFEPLFVSATIENSRYMVHIGR